MAKDKREYGLTAKDREWVIAHKFPSFSVDKINLALSKVEEPSDKILGAVLFLSHMDCLESLKQCVQLANSNTLSLLRAATVKDERT